MNVARAMCAPSNVLVAWHSINWRTCHKHVRRLQARIVKATLEGRWNKVKALQWLLTHSRSGKALAVKRVTENNGKKTPGVDGQTWSTPEAKTAAMMSLQRRGYQAQPLRRVYIPKSNGKQRPLGIPTMKDRAMQALHLLALDPVSETTADKHSYGFRKARSTHDALRQCFNVFGKPSGSPQWVLEADIRGCFDNISHDWMLKHIPMDTQVLQKWLKAGYVERTTMMPTTMGTPQGGIISPTLANMVLDGLERQLKDTFKIRRSKGETINPKVHLIRYADDFVISGDSPETLEQVQQILIEFLSERGLSLSSEKTRIVHLSEGFNFLGQNVRTYGGTMLIKPSKEALQSIYDKLRNIVQRNKSTAQHILIGLLNPVIQGWVNYHRYAVAKAVFSKLDSLIWNLLWSWATRRHPNKNRHWIARRYWHRQGSRAWIFATRSKLKYPERIYSLKIAAMTPIRRYRKVPGEVNPYSPQWKNYLADRHRRHGRDLLDGRAQLQRQWQSQDGRCLECDEPICPETHWNLHHVQQRADGGSERDSNLEMLHPNCHRRLHASVGGTLPGSLERALQKA